MKNKMFKYKKVREIITNMRENFEKSFLPSKDLKPQTRITKTIDA